MKKAILYVPAIVFAVGIVALNIILKTFSPLWYVRATGGFLMSKRKYWGCVLGLIPALHLMYMSTQYTGQVINIEFPLGFITAIYVLACGFGAWRKRSKRSVHNDVQTQEQ